MNNCVVSIRDVRYEKIPVSVYWKKYTGNTGILAFVLLDLQNHEMDEKSKNIEL